MRTAGLVVLLIMMWSELGFAAHPQLLLDTEELAFIRNKAASNSPDWHNLKTICDDLTTYAVQWPDAISGGSSLDRGYAAGSIRSPGVVYTGYNGGGFDKAITKLGVCYQALKTTNRGAAANYLEQAHNIIRVLSQRPLTLTREGDGAIRYGASVDFHGKDLRAGAPVMVFMPYSNPNHAGDPSKSVSVGEVWSISGATGCTSMNGTWRVAARAGNIVSFSSANGSSAVPLNANCTLFTFDPMRSGYPLRFWIPALAKAYDWFYDGLSQREKEDILFCIHAWLYELRVTGLASRHPENNFTFGNFWALVAAYVATDGENADWTAFYAAGIAEQFTAPNQILDYRRLWMTGGGFGEGWQAYGFNATRWMMDAVLAMKMHGTDWTQAPYHFKFVDDTLRYWMEFATPSKLALDDDEYVYPISATDKGVTEPVWIQLSHAVMFTAAARSVRSALAAQFQAWYLEVREKERSAAGKSVPAWNTGIYMSQPDPVDEFLYYDAQASSADWKTLPLMYRGWSGNYAVTRSDWSDTAVEVTLLGGPTVGSAGNGKTQFDSGSITIQRGNARLLVYGLGEAARSGDIVDLIKANQLHQERRTYGNKKNSIFWAGPSQEETRNQGLTSRTPPPGQLSNVPSWRSSIDRAEDTSTYTYWRATGLEANSASSAIDHKYHQTAWTREVLFLRPELVIVHDRTSVLNDGDDRAMFWTFGRNINRCPSPAGSVRFDASFKGTYRGAFTSLLPVTPSISVVDHDGMHFLYRVEVRPSAMDHKDDDWLALFDAANKPEKVRTFETLTATNADALEFVDPSHTVIAFPRSGSASLPISISCKQPATAYFAGLAPNTNYKMSFSNGVLTLATDDGTHRVMSTQAGIVRAQLP